MKTGILFILICLGAAWAAAQTHLDIKVPDTIENDLFGPVKSIQTVYNKERFLSISTKHSTKEYERIYDEKGNLLTRVNIDLDDKATNSTVYIYNEDGCLSGKTVADIDSKTNKINTYTYTINLESKQILRHNLSNDQWRVTAYNPDGYEYYIEDRSESNTVTSVLKIKRLPNNKEYEFATVDGEGNPTRTSRFKWNSNGLMRENYYRRHGTNEYIYTTQYAHPKKDETGNWTKRVARTERFHDGEKNTYSEEIAVRNIEYFDK